MERFEISALDVGGGQLALARQPGSTGKLAEDVRALADWGAERVLSLTETEEQQGLGAAALPQQLEAQGIAWMHFPIRDFDVPEAHEAEAWGALQQEILNALGSGGRVLVHCRGGCGRSGMIVLRLMLACGEALEDALKRLRVVRRCAVETDAQMRWATEGALQQA
ncbi:dual specificity protein phosphatase family protein [Shimia sp. R9_2]|uniref:phosphatase domain-containing protein n=1 Tax=Shimia sp. R9_2 TaxID=2821112 RepID=UPI001ADC60A0|nr:dual specificity protein phosphatase family protein [Shimia sp. R9_2]MBO9397736.1 dual specificity protein phosphatase family protein [Shimia sp. R9_2]